MREHVKKKLNEKVTWNPICLKLDYVWWSPKFCIKRTLIVCNNKK